MICDYPVFIPPRDVTTFITDASLYKSTSTDSQSAYVIGFDTTLRLMVTWEYYEACFS